MQGHSIKKSDLKNVHFVNSVKEDKLYLLEKMREHFGDILIWSEHIPGSEMHPVDLRLMKEHILNDLPDDTQFKNNLFI